MVLAPSLRCFGDFPLRPLDYFGQVNFHRAADAQHGFQSRVPHSALNVGNHLRRKARFLGDKVLGQFAPFSLLLEKGNYFGANCLRFAIHSQPILKKTIDSVFHYGEIAAYRLGVARRNTIECVFMAGSARILQLGTPPGVSELATGPYGRFSAQKTSISQCPNTGRVCERESDNSVCAPATTPRDSMLEIRRSILRKLAARLDTGNCFRLLK